MACGSLKLCFMEIRPLSLEEQQALKQGRALAVQFAETELPFNTQSVQSLYNAIAALSGLPSEVYIALGIAFGDLISEAADFDWVRISDEYGDETALCAKSVRVICAPISMMQKRLERDEDVNISQLVENTISQLNETAKTADLRERS